MVDQRKLSRLAKRTIDVVGAASALVLLAPVMGAIAVAILRDSGVPVLFTQVRPGVDGEPFCMRKFRTMHDRYGVHGEPLPDCDRLTKVGATLRRWSLDELPELWNILIGDMSIVGPRPLLMDYLPLYTPQEMRRHDVRPGLTGLAQVNGRNDQSWDDRLALDVFYVDHWTLWMDMKIIGTTAGKVLMRSGVSAPGHVSMHRFEGSGYR